MDKTTALSLELQGVADALDQHFEERLGMRIGFVLVCHVEDVSQYVSNLEREGGKALIESLLERWKAGKADIPAHYNPDLKDSTLKG